VLSEVTIETLRDGLAAPVPSATQQALHHLVPNYFYQPNRTLARYAASVRGVQQAAVQLCPAKDPNLASQAARAPLPLAPNAVGEILLAILDPSVDKRLEERCRFDSHLAAARILVAMHAHQQEQGELPLQLEALVPRYLTAVPPDAFGGAPFEWDPAHRSLANVRGTRYAIASDRRRP
jgi:hypothetical protein